eukprot:Phypoly_transcript_13674.p1 GENE.Phypoly_transcript_13674~~Phypoly_transcript_13674.p1  ORF type:complete len:117 (+),score=9.05 Phypoly_transcript_13674:201-551(+)
MLKENTELAGKGNAFLPVVFVGHMYSGRPMIMVNSPDLIREVSEDSVSPKQFAIRMTANSDELIAYLRARKGEEVDCLEVLSEAKLSVLIDSIFREKTLSPSGPPKRLAYGIFYCH